MADQFEEDFLREDVVADGAGPAAGGWGLDGQGEMPSMEQIMEMIDKAGSLTEEERASLKEDLLKSSQGIPIDGNYARAAAAGGLFTQNAYLFVFLVALVALIIGFFAYKLIKREMDKEKARELKRLAKEQKKNKKKK